MNHQKKKKMIRMASLILASVTFVSCSSVPIDIPNSTIANESAIQENKNLNAEETMIQFYSLIRDNKIDEAFEITHYEPQYQYLKENGIEQLKQFDNKMMTFDIIDSEQINDNIFIVHLNLYNTPDKPENPEIYMNIAVYVLEENNIYRVIQQDFNIPEKYRENVVMGEMQIKPEDLIQID